MSSKKISELTAASALDGTETVPLVQGGGTVRALISAIKTYLNGVASTWSAAQTFSSTVALNGAVTATSTFTINSNSAATIIEGSFTGTLSGMTTATTGTVSYRISANAAGTGKICRLYLAAGIAGTSNTTAMTMTGLPAACTPSAAVETVCSVVENDTSQLGRATIAASGTTITFATDLPFSATGFTGGGGKGLSSGWQIEYAL